MVVLYLLVRQFLPTTDHKPTTEKRHRPLSRLCGGQLLRLPLLLDL